MAHASMSRYDHEQSTIPAIAGDDVSIRNALLPLQNNDESSPSTQTHLPTLEDIFQDWSGRGSHVDFLPNETIPLEQGRFLGHGSMGSVYETTVKGYAFAWKRIYCRHKISEKDRKEIKILRKVSHHHIIKLAGSYTHKQFLGLLLSPVAKYDLATLMEDVEAYFFMTADAVQQERLGAFGLFRNSIDVNFLLSKIGCIVTAVEYLHERKIRHKDLKPSNILLSPGGLWLTDFGTATDFSLQTVSTTEGWERGTPKYFAPEVARYEPSGRAADIFSLGCVLLEICTLFRYQTLVTLRKLRSAQDKSFHANLSGITEWIRDSPSWSSWGDDHLKKIICDMLERNPDDRPVISRVCEVLSYINIGTDRGLESLFGDCCKEDFTPLEVRKQMLARQKEEHDLLIAKHEEELSFAMQLASSSSKDTEMKQILQKRQPELASLREFAELYTMDKDNAPAVPQDITALKTDPVWPPPPPPALYRNARDALQQKLDAFNEILENEDPEQIRQRYPRCVICSKVFPSSRDIDLHMFSKHQDLVRVWKQEKD